MSPTAERPARVVSIDIFRGLTMATMIFVNELSGVKGLPWWTYHARWDQDAMTYVDMVFPFFLFLVGMSMPLGIAERLRRSGSRAALWGHVLARTAGLLALGLMLANADHVVEGLTGIGGNLWLILGLVSAALYLNAYPRESWLGRREWLPRGLGLAGVVVLFALFRGPIEHGHATWIDFSYPEILGLIGITYFATSLLYIPTRHLRWAPAAWFVLAAAFNILCAAHAVVFPARVGEYLWPFSNGARVALMMAGAALSALFLGPGRLAPRRAMMMASGAALVLLAAGFLLTPLGISKDRETPSWMLWNVAAATLVFVALYWLCDLKGKTRWAWPVRTAGGNTLTTYLLPDLWDAVLGACSIGWLGMHWVAGWPGVVRTLVFTAIILGLSRLVTRLGVRLRF